MYWIIVVIFCTTLVSSFLVITPKSSFRRTLQSVAPLGIQNSHDIMSNEWSDYFQRSKNSMKFQVIAAPDMEKIASSIVALQPHRFLYHPTHWNKFPDGTDNIEIGGFKPSNCIAGENVLFLASFHNNDVTLSQFSVMITLLQSFISSLTVVLPFYPVGTMERIIHEGQVATANTYAQMFSSLPSCGKPTRLVIYDLHTLQNRFYLHNNAIASLQTTIPILLDHIQHASIDTIAFPDDGAAKRFADLFPAKTAENTDNSVNAPKNTANSLKTYDIITCGKTRSGSQRTVCIQQGSAQDKHVLIVDDLVQTGSTLYECACVLRAQGAKSVSVFVAHAVFPNAGWKRFSRHHQGDRAHVLEKFYVTNSIPTVTDLLPRDDVFEVLELQQKIIDDLDGYSN